MKVNFFAFFVLLGNASLILCKFCVTLALKSIGYPEFELPIRAHKKHYPLF